MMEFLWNYEFNKYLNIILEKELMKSTITKVYGIPFGATFLNRENYCYYLFLTQHLDDG